MNIIPGFYIREEDQNYYLDKSSALSENGDCKEQKGCGDTPQFQEIDKDSQLTNSNGTLQSDPDLRYHKDQLEMNSNDQDLQQYQNNKNDDIFKDQEDRFSRLSDMEDNKQEDEVDQPTINPFYHFPSQQNQMEAISEPKLKTNVTDLNQSNEAVSGSSNVDHDQPSDGEDYGGDTRASTSIENNHTQRSSNKEEEKTPKSQMQMKQQIQYEQKFCQKRPQNFNQQGPLTNIQQKNFPSDLKITIPLQNPQFKDKQEKFSSKSPMKQKLCGKKRTRNLPQGGSPQEPIGKRGKGIMPTESDDSAFDDSQTEWDAKQASGDCITIQSQYQEDQSHEIKVNQKRDSVEEIKGDSEPIQESDDIHKQDLKNLLDDNIVISQNTSQIIPDEESYTKLATKWQSISNQYQDKDIIEGNKLIIGKQILKLIENTNGHSERYVVSNLFKERVFLDIEKILTQLGINLKYIAEDCEGYRNDSNTIKNDLNAHKALMFLFLYLQMPYSDLEKYKDKKKPNLTPLRLDYYKDEFNYLIQTLQFDTKHKENKEKQKLIIERLKDLQKAEVEEEEKKEIIQVSFEILSKIYIRIRASKQ